MKSVTSTNRKPGRGLIAGLAFSLLLTACASNDGAYYDNDGPGSRSAEEFVDAPDAQPRDEPILAVSTRPYTVFGKQYFPLKQRQPIMQTGQASWYGKQFHGRPTSIGETYDMYAMTAAHPTLPLPSYVRVTNLETQKSVVVRVNDRGPFLHDRIIDLSFAAAAKLGYTDQGTAEVMMEVVDPVVVTLQALRTRVGLPANKSVETLAAAAQTDEEALPLRAAAQLPVTDAQVASAAPGAAIASAASRAAVVPSTATPQPVNSPVPASAAPSLPPVLLPSASSGAESVGDTPAELPTAKPQVVESLQLAKRKNRQIADVFIPPDVTDDQPVPLPVGEPPVIQVEALEGNGLRRAVPERIAKRKPTGQTRKLASKSSDEPVFVVPYKDQLKKEVTTERAPRVYLQLGAYDTEKSARVALVEVEVALKWLRQPVAIIADRGRHKIQAGPFASAKRAQAAARRIRSGSSFSPFYVFR